MIFHRPYTSERYPLIIIIIIAEALPINKVMPTSKTEAPRLLMNNGMNMYVVYKMMETNMLVMKRSVRSLFDLDM